MQTSRHKTISKAIGCATGRETSEPMDWKEKKVSQMMMDVSRLLQQQDKNVALSTWTYKEVAGVVCVRL